MFEVGQKVVCVDDNYDEKQHMDRISRYNWEFPRKDEIYTVRELFIESIVLEEIVNNIDLDIGKEPMFYFWHFRPLEALLDEIDLQKELSIEIPVIEGV